MSIAGISGSSNLYQYLQSLNGSTATGSTTPPTAPGADSTLPSAGTLRSPATSSTSSGGTSLVQQLETAIQSALNGVNSSEKNSPQAALSSIEQAVQTTLQQNGINTSQVSQAGGHHHHGGHHGGGKGGSAGGVLAALTSSAGSTSSSSGISASGNTSSTSQTPGLDSLLSQLNVDPQQFRNDVVSALAGSQNGNVSQSQVFQSFPSGQNLNALA